MEKDSRVYLIGEDICDPYGGAFKVTKGLSSRFPGRVLNTPISEAAIVGIAGGMVLRGLCPIVEIMFGDFITLCTDQIINHLAKFRGMYNGDVHVPVVIRTPMGGGRGYGATHSQCLEKIFFGVPGLNVIAPSHFHDPGKLLLRAVMNSTDPVLFIEHKLLYPLQLILEDDEELVVELKDEKHGYPTSIIRNYKGKGENPDVTIISYGGVSRLIEPLLRRMSEEEIRIVVCFPSLINVLPEQTIIECVLQSRRVIVVEEGSSGFNWGSEVASLVYEKAYKQLLKPIIRLSSKNTIIPAARHLEDAVLISEKDIESAIVEVLI